MVEVAKRRMEEYDWKLLGHELYDKSGKANLPTRRLDIPIPESSEGLYEIAHKLAFLSQEMSRIARLSDDARMVMSNVDSLLRLSRQQFVQVRRTWEMELRQSLAAEKKDEYPQEHIRAIG